MLRRLAFTLVMFVVAMLLPACAAPLPGSVRHAGGSAALVGQFQARDGRSGRALSFAELAARCRAADVVLFGEQHNNVVCNAVEAQLAAALAADRRPLTLALEFFETDTQAAVDAYLAGWLDEEGFREFARQGGSYLVSHRPIVELARRERIPVLATNAPRRLVRGYRLSRRAFEEYRAGLEPEDRRWLPPANDALRGGYERRFSEIMGGDGTIEPDSDLDWLYRAQLLWDETMAERIADHRARFAERRVLLLVGVFHVADYGGTERKLRTRRPQDRIVTIVFRPTENGRFAFDEEDRGTADVVIYGMTPPPPPAREMAAPHPTTAPATAPAPEEEIEAEGDEVEAEDAEEAGGFEDEDGEPAVEWGNVSAGGAGAAGRTEAGPAGDGAYE